MKAFLVLFAATMLLTGCMSTVKYAPSAAWGRPDVRSLGPVKADSGPWPLSLNVPPPEYTYQAALRDKAASTYNVPPGEIVLGEITVQFAAEMVGTIRSWKASADAGQKNSVTTTKP